MPSGKIAGFDRPLAETELIINTALDVTRDYGNNLENSEFRAEQEKVMKQELDAVRLTDLDVELSPSGFVVGVRIATGETEISDQIIEDVEDGMNGVVNNFDQVDGFVVPSGVRRGALEQVREFRYTIIAK